MAAPSSAELQEYFDAARRRHKVPGAAVGIIHKGREVVATSGVTSVDAPVPVDDRTLFMIGSTSKTFTATALMRLVDELKLGLDDPVVKHLPKFRLKDRAATRALTLRNLMTHTGGWDGDIDLDTGWGDDALEKYVAAMKDQPQRVPVGRFWSYNNAGFCVAGRVIEVVTGQTLEQAVRDLVFAPLGMADSFFSPVDVVTRRHAVGHTNGGARPAVAHAWGLGRALAAAGGIVSSVRDQLKYARFHLGDGTAPDGRRLLRKKTFDLMQSELAPAGNFADSVGISWFTRDAAGVRTVAHGGNVSNLQISRFLMAPDRGFAITVLTNSTNGGGLSAEVEKWALERYLGVVEEPPALVSLNGTNLDDYAGTYKANLSQLEVKRRGDRLVATSSYNINVDELPEEDRELVRRLLSAKPKPLTLGFFAPDRAVVVSGPGKGQRGEFLRESPGGPVKFLRWGGRLVPRTG